MDAFSIEDQSFILDRSEQLAAQHRKYMEEHPELTQLFHDFLTNCLVNKPDDCFQFCNEYFTGFLGGDGVGDFVDGWGYSPCRVLLLVGPSGAAKRHAALQLCKIHDDKFALVVAHTTRERREWEKDGVDYVFTSREAMEIGMSAGEFMGVSMVEGELYGVKLSRWEALAETRRVGIIPCDIGGALAYRRSLAGELAPKSVLIRVNPASLGGDDDEAGRAAAAEEFYADADTRKGLFDASIEVELDEEGAWTSTSIDSLTHWCLNQDWRVLTAAEFQGAYSKAATKIQSQARKRRDINRVKAIKQQSKQVNEI